MPQTPETLRSLRQLRAWRDAPPRAGRLLARGWRGYLVLLGGAVISTVAAFSIGQHWIGAATCGLALGALLRDLRWTRSLARNWPLTAAITDWARVDALLAGDDAPPSSTSHTKNAP